MFKNTVIFSFLALSLFSCTKNTMVDPLPENNLLPTEFKALYRLFDGQGIGAATNINDDIMLFISSNGQEYAWFENNEIKRKGRVDEENGLFDGIAFSTIGSLIDFDEERLAIFNAVGGTYQWAHLDPDAIPGNSDLNNHFTFQAETFQLWEWGADNTCPFDEITALFGFSKEAEGCTTTEDDDLYLWMVSDDGDELVRYVKDGGTFDNAVDIEIWRSNNVCGGSPAIFPLSGIGAACVYDPDGGLYQELFFSPDGKKMTILTPSQASYSEVYELE